MKMLPSLKPHGPFKDSNERREFEVRSHFFRVSGYHKFDQKRQALSTIILSIFLLD